MILLSLLWTLDAAASTTEQTLLAGHAVLEQGDWSRGLALLGQLPSDPQVAYYRAFALEKLHRCADARAFYIAVGTTDARMAAYPEKALAGLDHLLPDPHCFRALTLVDSVSMMEVWNA